jgi:anti-anti-sigma factor
MNEREPSAEMAPQSLGSAEDRRGRDLAVRISGRELGHGRLLKLAQPYAVVGRSAHADISLESSKLSFRHAYLQVLDRRVLCVDLKSKTGVLWKGQRRSCGWLSESEPVQIGPYHLRLAGEGVGDFEDATDDAPADALMEPVQPGSFPQYCLELFDDSIDDPIRSIDRRVSLIGRDANCALRLNDSSVSRVHCALVLEHDGLWVVDLLGRGGIRVDGKPVQMEQAQSGSELVVGKHAMSFWRREPELRTAGKDDCDDDKPATRADESRVPADMGEWLGTLFAVERKSETLVVTPRIHSGMFRYAKLQLELNALRHKLSQSDVSNLVVDLSGLDYAGSEVMCAVVALARQTESRGGRIALCSATTQVERVFKSMGLSRVWTLYPTQDAALTAVKAR